MGARALVTTTLALLILVSSAPSPTAAVEPTDPTVPTETPVEPAPAPPTDATPTLDVTPPTDVTPPADTTVAPVAKPVVARPRTTEAQQIIRIARRQLGEPWRYGARGPRAFDCSGLVIYSFKHAGDSKAVARGRLASARALYRWYKARGLASRHHPKVGDLVIWGGGTHVGIYVGNGRAISTLNRGVRVHRVHAVTAPFTAYLHTGMWKKASN
jgi:cell wall-associated NlpC family hydrolase